MSEVGWSVGVWFERVIGSEDSAARSMLRRLGSDRGSARGNQRWNGARGL
jgi:hypothetical protein